MATHNYIFKAEQLLIEANHTTLETLSAYCCERGLNKDGKPHHQNRALWRDLRIVVCTLRDSCNRLLEEMDKDNTTKLR